MGQLVSLCCGTICGGGVWEGTVLLVQFSASFQSLPTSFTHKQIGPVLYWFPGGWVCVHSRTLWISPTDSPVRLRVSLASTTPTGIFQPEVLRLYFPALEPWVVRSVLLPSCSSWFIGTQMWTANSASHRLTSFTSCRLAHPSPLVSTLPRVLSTLLPRSYPPMGLDECFFNSSVVGPPYSSIFCQFWLFLF